MGHVAEYPAEDTKFRSAVSALAVAVTVTVLNVGTNHTRPVRRSMRTCKKSWPVAGARYRKFDEVEADAAAATPRHGHGSRPAGGRW